MPSSGYSSLPIQDFSGGWNPQDAWSKVEDDELIDMINISLDKKGGMVKRLGTTKVNPSGQISSAGSVQSLHYSAAIDTVLAQIGTQLFKSTDGGVSWTASIKTFTTADPVGMVDFLGKVVVIHKVDRTFSYDGTTFAGPIANSPAGTSITVWQNALWSGGDPALPSTLTRSDLGNITWPASPVTNQLRVKDDQPITAVGGGEGMDTEGRDGFLVFKEASTYRVHNLADAAYTVVDFQFGASGPKSITTNNGVTGAISRRGIIIMRGDASEPLLASHKLSPLFRRQNLSFTQSHLMAAGNFEDRMIFSLPWDGSTTNNLTLEYHPSYEWIVPHSCSASAFTSYTKNTRALYGAKIGTDASTHGYVLDFFTGGSDDGADISCRAQTKWFEPNGGSSIRFRRAVVNARGIFSLFVKRDYDSGVGELFPISIQGQGGIWGSATWGVDTYGINVQQDYQEIFSLGVGRSISFEIQESSSITASSTPFLDDGAAETLGAISLYGINTDMVPLGRS